MTVLDITKVTFDNVCIFTETADFDYIDLFKGKVSDVPSSLLDKHVESVYATRKHMLDIRIDF